MPPNNKKIAANTLMLYLRMFVMLAVALYTSRVVLQALGVVDYGIYNLIGGLVSLFTLLNGTLVNTTQRFITYALGLGDRAQLNKIFSIAVNAHVLIALLTLALLESVGLWFFREQLNIDADRRAAAMIVFQLSAFSCLLAIVTSPFHADIISHEKMSVFAGFSVLEGSLKLGTAFLLPYIQSDKLIAYAALLAAVELAARLLYVLYCYTHFSESHYRWYHDAGIEKELFSFAGWNFFGSAASLSFNQGLSMLLNIFFGSVVNAARGIATQAQTALLLFITNFQTAVSPQIVKTYAQGDYTNLHLLMMRSSRLSYYLILLLSLPILCEAPLVLQLWLGEVPEHTTVFLRIGLCTAMLYTIIQPVIVANGATGDIKTYNIVCGSLLISILPLSYLALSAGAPAYSVYLVHLGIELVTQGARLLLVRRKLRLSLSRYIGGTYLRMALVTLVCLPLPIGLCLSMRESLLRALLVGLSSCTLVSLAALTLGVSAYERRFLLSELTRHCRKLNPLGLRLP